MKIFFTIVLAFVSVVGVRAQAVKTNLLYDATATINIGAEFRTGGRTSVDIPFSYNPWDFGGEENRKWKHFLVQPALRFWAKETFHGWFLGLHAHYAYYNLGSLPLSDYTKAHHFEGEGYGGGLSVGYRWNFKNPHWAMEAELGAGYTWLDYKKYDCGNCGQYIGHEKQGYFAPTKAAVNLIYAFNGVVASEKTEKAERVARERVVRERVVEEGPEREETAKRTKVKAVKERDNVLAVATPKEKKEKPVRERRPRRDRSGDDQQQVAQATGIRFIPSFVVPEPEFSKERVDAIRANLEFVFDVATLDPVYRNNAQELRKLRLAVSDIRRARNTAITEVDVTGYASPEGTEEYNQILSERRAAAVRDFLLTSTDLPAMIFDVHGEGERPDGLRVLVEVGYTVQPFTLEEAKREFMTRPQALSLDEMFQVACTYDPESDQYRNIFETGAMVFPDSDIANINAAAAALIHNDAASAAKYLERVRIQTPAWWDNVGIVFFLRGDMDRAAAAFTNAGTTGLDNAATLQRVLNKR